MTMILTSTDKVAATKGIKQITGYQVPPEPIKIRGFKAHCSTELGKTRKNFLLVYCDGYDPDCDTPHVSFVDYGDRIQLHNQYGQNEPNDKDIKGALKLFQKKFPGQMMLVVGDEDIRVRMTEIATEMGIVVANPEMQQLVAQLKGEEFKDTIEEDAVFSAPGM